jgi:hypothetical protein
MSVLRNVSRRNGVPATLGHLAAQFEGLASRVEEAVDAVERELLSATADFDLRLSEAPVTGFETKPLAAHPHTRTAHRHETLCERPAGVVAELRRVATSLRGLDELIPRAGLRSPVVPRRSVRRKPPRRVPRIDVARSVESLVGWLSQRGWKRGDGDWRASARRFAGTRVHDAIERPDGATSREVAVCRALTELVDGMDTDATRATRHLSQTAFDVAEALEALVSCVRCANSETAWDLGRSEDAASRGPLVADAEASNSPLPFAFAGILDGTMAVAQRLHEIDAEIGMNCLWRLEDSAPRGVHPEHALFLAVILHLEKGGFTNAEIAGLIDDGFGGTPKARTRRVSEHLETQEPKKSGKVRDRRTEHIRGRSV